VNWAVMWLSHPENGRIIGLSEGFSHRLPEIRSGVGGRLGMSSQPLKAARRHLSCGSYRAQLSYVPCDSSFVGTTGARLVQFKGPVNPL